MTMFVQSNARRGTVYRKLANTTAVSLITPVASNPAVPVVIESLIVSCRGGGSTFDLYVLNGSTSYFIAEARAISANDQYILKDHHITLPNSEWSLMFKDITGNKLDVSLVYFTPMQQKDDVAR